MNNNILIAKICHVPFQGDVFFYKISNDYCIGDLVLVPLLKRKLIGIIIDIEIYYNTQNNIKLINGKSLDQCKIKNVKICIYPKFLSNNFIRFLKFASRYNIQKLPYFIESSISNEFIKELINPIKKKIKIEKIIKKIDFLLNNEQEKIKLEILNTVNKFCISIINGVTGSGKTHVFLSIANEILNSNPDTQILIMTPEISLTNIMYQKICDLCGIVPTLWHSGLTTANRRNNYQSIIDGNAKIILSTRSGIFLPIKNLSLIIIDEEHDSSYKQNEVPIYHARDMAIFRAKIENIPIILTSATISLETLMLQNTKQLFLNSKYFDSNWPKISLLNNRYEENILCPEAIDLINQTLLDDKQAMIFINRRGFSRALVCKKCYFEFKCQNCDNLLSYHKKKLLLKCHLCSKATPIPKSCPMCCSAELIFHGGVGVEQIAEKISKFIPSNKKMSIISSDETKNSTGQNILDIFAVNDIDLLIGTQIISKGHHFSNLKSLIILDIDNINSDGDFRAFERIFQMLIQLIGRVGRELSNGKIIIQTNDINSKFLEKICNYDIQKFQEMEIKNRKDAILPPFGNYIAIIISSNENEEALNFAIKFRIEFDKYIEKLPIKMKIFGPNESFVKFLKKSYRYRFMIKTNKDIKSLDIIGNFYNLLKIPKNIQVKIDVNPYIFY